MWPYHPDLIERPVPRYTSYPTAAEFADVGAGLQAAALAAIAPHAELSLYVHIPYCQEICWYCGCNTGAANRAGRISSYLEALEAEIHLLARHLAGRGRVVRIAFGGGSPNAISPLAFVRLLDRIVTELDAAAAEISIELDPRSLDAPWFDVLRDTRVTRASLGVQTLAPDIQQAIGRIQPIEMIERAVDGLRGAGIESLNFDLMYGLPHQHLADLDATLIDAMRMAPDRIALFGYAHLPTVIPRQRRIDASGLPDARRRFEQAAHGYKLLTDAGYHAIGFDHFARPSDTLAVAAAQGRLHRNFQGFTDDPSDILLGLGVSAISQFPELIVQNEKMAGRYRMLVGAHQLAGRRGVVRHGDDRWRGEVIEALLCSGEARMSEDRLARTRHALEPFVERGLVRCGPTWVRLLPTGLPYARAVASCFDGYRALSNGLFSHAV
ncbi:MULTISPECIES: oxygen-independent coproporphyrinogen III oxidase [unclassified Sphingomonas]|uniref:oxygen-independent coproporphyrinogen III oxidase n=1 Tax=unclassified Sphingomonas TaxID=196159 RepID=UPI0006FEA429|nr:MULTISPECIES: oxygen-independent coproporphyrinogen III oxidase [unclassified Sphingomonas]KQX23574.1 coproporphyrinogen III oxidase [Sphingomonas sp. Root1294]KQY68424.1 coproporphyrinogen III oxidase [Sphingomonas sp. Root50]KRB91384.1 coproporphyrinogen III oxidase [Sphingomonas sp. Root720]